MDFVDVDDTNVADDDDDVEVAGRRFIGSSSIINHEARNTQAATAVATGEIYPIQ